MTKQITLQTAKAMDTEALHASGGGKHLVAVKSLRVLLSPDEDGWFAQGLEIDYAATGASIEAVKSNFADGLALTVHEHLKVFGSISKLLKVAPQEAWQDYLSATPENIKQRFTTYQLHKISPDHNSDSDEEVEFPFEEILFVKSAAIRTHVGAETADCA